MEADNKVSLIILTGPKHSGKSRAALAYARRYSCVCKDLDAMISEATSKSPRSLYQEGVEQFRNAEYHCLAHFLESIDGSKTEYILAAGGGLIDNEKAWALIKGRAHIVYLQLSAQSAWERIAAKADKEGALPPFLQGDNPRCIHKELHESRGKRYRSEADIIIEADNKKPDEIAALINYNIKR